MKLPAKFSLLWCYNQDASDDGLSPGTLVYLTENKDMVKTMQPRILFIIIAELGHVTYAARLREFADSDPRIQATWIYIKPSSEARYFWEKAGPWLPQQIAYSLLVRRRIKEFLTHILFIHTIEDYFYREWTKKKYWHWVLTVPPD